MAVKQSMKQKFSRLIKAIKARRATLKHLQEMNNDLFIDGGRWRSRSTGRFLGEEAKNEVRERINRMKQLQKEINDIQMKLDLLKEGGSLNESKTSKSKDRARARSRADYEKRSKLKRCTKTIGFKK